MSDDELERGVGVGAWLATLLVEKDAHERTAVLSNGTRAMIEAALGAASLRVDELRSVDELRVYKPDPRVYGMLDELAPVAATLFVSSNGFDAEGAKRTGRQVCFIDRGGPQPGLGPDLQIRSLAELAVAWQSR